MKEIDLIECKLKFKKHYIILELKDGAHFDSRLFEQSYELKLNYYGTKPVGIIIPPRENKQDSYSFNPLILIEYYFTFKAQVKWVALLSNDSIDVNHLEYVKKFTKIPCYIFKNEKELISRFRLTY